MNGLACRALRLRWPVWALYTAFIAFIWHCHEPWADEVDSWVIARDATAGDFFRYFSLSGHPALWYAVQWPFARLMNAGIGMQGLVHLGIASALGWLLLFRAPLPNTLRIAMLFSVPLAYQYAVVTRGYSLMLLMLSLALLCYPSRFEKPLRYALLLALCYHTEIWAWPIAGMLSLYFVCDLLMAHRRKIMLPHSHRRYGCAVLVIALGGLAALWSLWPIMSANPLISDTPPSLMRSIGGLGVGFFPLANMGLTLDTANAISPALGTLADAVIPPAVPSAIALLLLSFFLLQWHMRAMLMLAGWLMSFFVISTLSATGFHHDLMAPLFLVFALWFAHIDGSNRKPLNPLLARVVYGLLTLSFLCSGIMTGIASAYDMRMLYSAGPSTAQFIRSQEAQPALIVLGCHTPIAVTAHLPGYRFYLAGQQRSSSYYLWDEHMSRCYQLTDEDALQRTAETMNIKGALIVSTRALAPATHSRLLYHSEGLHDTFWVYRHD